MEGITAEGLWSTVHSEGASSDPTPLRAAGTTFFFIKVQLIINNDVYETKVQSRSEMFEDYKLNTY